MGAAGSGDDGTDRNHAVGRFEIAAAVILSLTALITSWSGYQAELWDGEEAANYTQAGAARVWIRVRGGLVVGDLQVGEAGFAGTLEVLRDLARRAGLAGISFIVSPGTAVHRLFAAEYTSEPSFPVLFQDLGATIPLEEIRFSYSDIDIF